MPKVHFYPDNRGVEVENGESILRAAMLAGVHINASCGGSGTCGKCRIVVEEGDVEKGTSAKLSAEQIAQGYALACKTRVQGDIEVRIPVESQMGDSRAALEREQRPVTHGSVLTSKDLSELFGDFALETAIRRVYVELANPNLEDNVSDLERLKRELTRVHGIGDFTVDLTCLKQMATKLREADWKVTATLMEGTDGECPRLIRLDAGDHADKHYGLAVDIGTTSVYAELIDLNTRESLGKVSEYNAQVSCGEDIISRIVYSLKKDGLTRLQGLIADTINGLIGRLLEKTGVDRDDIVYMVAAGNTTMTHLFFGINARYIREEPYIPTINFTPTVQATDLGIDIAEGARVHCIPGRASYVGGDITSGLLASGVYKTDKLTLYIDVGTNGEMALGNAEWLLSCACSAGPAFEGGSVKYGMRAVKGAIEAVRINQDTLEPMILTIGQTRAKGICGSGLIDVLAELFLTGAITEKGKFNLELGHPRIREVDGQGEYVLVWANESAIREDIVVTEADIDNLIRTKGAIYAGITTLLDSMQMPVEAIEQVLIAGGFGRYLELDKAITIGLLPEIAADKVKYVGNGSLMGAHLVLLSQAARRSAKEIAQKMTYLELSTNPSFMDNYVSALFLPHTNTDAFPSVMERIRERSRV
ncbi:MAG TPA: ASKHA domain-containing protein [Anaerolineae bacterium]|nr:ASKHA domain-containing protein [Anaerolineae bacterium]